MARRIFCGYVGTGTVYPMLRYRYSIVGVGLSETFPLKTGISKFPKHNSTANILKPNI